MRRIDPDGKDHGAVAVIVAILLVVLLGFAAIVVDVGMLYAEKAQLRNGADAAALSIAQTCAEDISDPKCTSSVSAGSLAKEMSDANALDNQSNPSNVTLNEAAGKVSVTTGALEEGTSSNRVSLFFAHVLGVTDAEVKVTSHAAWGKPVAGPAIFPLALAECKLDLAPAASNGSVQLLEMGNNGCGWVPGGFGWLDTNPLSCRVSITAPLSGYVGAWHASDPGASAPSVCGSSDFDRIKDQTVLFPLYDAERGTGNNAEFHIKGFAAFHVTAYHFASYDWALDGTSVCNKCIEGYFKRFVTLDDAYTLDPNAPSNGTNVVKLTLGEGS
ncbi:Tad domain-containing protein [Arthrobacter sp. EH-1B-1]|uniref:Tad domain-containing protein n=1 Tax=Arthrobacter vasquezii TaxID=2977629 RepID=A0ABT6D0R3_9MICC|nr:TadE/TadG family type IV pilus assembly protein [Arthrobacter vasquezii]MDF9279237.1 Tad domain-containing protein [Arthrobacter vasquezii]